MSNIIFITGTDTGVGKTVLTSLLYAHFCRHGIPVRALKPFCTGDRQDALVLWRLQAGALDLEQVNPWYYKKPLAPWVAAGQRRKGVPLEAVLGHIQNQARKSGVLLVEGVGGLMVPLSNGYGVLEVILGIGCPVCIVAPNQLGVINHVLLTVNALETHKVRDWRVVLMDRGQKGVAERTNHWALRKLLGEKRVVSMKYIDSIQLEINDLTKHAKLFQKPLALASGIRNLSQRYSAVCDVALEKRD
jgi:dethiobiotin synthetase